MIDLRSDTVTRPSPGMRQAMATAEVGDDVYGEDPSVRALEERVADLLGKPSALFTPTGSMANLLAVRALVPTGQEVLCEASAHIARAELGAHATFMGITMRTWSDPRGEPDLAQIEALVAPAISPFLVATAAVSIENTHNFAGGTVLDSAATRGVRALADERGLGVHLDGARLWNAHVATGESLADLAAVADVVSVSLSKGLGAPAGSLLVGQTEVVAEARIWRKRLGGGMRQVGVLAAAGTYALDTQLDQLADDHAHAQLIAAACGVGVPDTNIVVLAVGQAGAFVAAAAAEGVAVSAVGDRVVRVVTHRDVDRPAAERAAEVLARLCDGER